MTTAGQRAGLRPPYLLTTATPHRDVGVTVTSDASTAVIEMTVHGQWSHHLGEQVSAGLRLCLAGPSASIIIDLQHVRDPRGAGLPFWLAAWRQARLGMSPVRLAFCLPAATALSFRLRNLKGPQPRVFAAVTEARVAITEGMSRADRVQARLEPRPASVRLARDLVTRACHAWQMPHLLPDIALIVSELAGNAVEHARTDFVVTVSRSAPKLHVAVRDGVTRFPRPNEAALTGPPDAVGGRGRGLWLVHAMAAAWGAMPTRAGKVVWATVQ